MSPHQLLIRGPIGGRNTQRWGSAIRAHAFPLLGTLGNNFGCATSERRNLPLRGSRIDIDRCTRHDG